ncbi:CopG family transcriptional regulator [Porticoccus sp.]
MENRTARLTLLIDPKKKALFEKLCSDEDVTPSQKVRQLIREYIEQNVGPNWREEVFGQEDQDS